MERGGEVRIIEDHCPPWTLFKMLGIWCLQTVRQLDCLLEHSICGERTGRFCIVEVCKLLPVYELALFLSPCVPWRFEDQVISRPRRCPFAVVYVP